MKGGHCSRTEDKRAVIGKADGGRKSFAKPMRWLARLFGERILFRHARDKTAGATGDG